jgi:hypothetical protein
MSTFKDMIDFIYEQNQEIAKLRSINEALVKQVEELNRAKLKQD